MIVLFFCFIRSPHPYFRETDFYSCTFTTFSVSQLSNTFQAAADSPRALKICSWDGEVALPIKAFIASMKLPFRFEYLFSKRLRVLFLKG